MLLFAFNAVHTIAVIVLIPVLMGAAAVVEII
jgi:hypothetical protein